MMPRREPSDVLEAPQTRRSEAFRAVEPAASAIIGWVADISLIYVGDPMCSWCWGFTPVLEDVLEETGLHLDVVVGGLRPGPAAEPLAGGLGIYLEREWATIGERTGQPFDPRIFGELGDQWVYDTELADMAVVRMRDLAHDRTLSFFVRLQRAFYAERTDVTDRRSYRRLVRGFDVDPEEFVGSLGEDELRRQTWRDFATARRWGVTGFPTLLFRREGRLGVITAGYRPTSDVLAAVSSLI